MFVGNSVDYEFRVAREATGYRTARPDEAAVAA
jgi:hypothetical protein